MGLLDTLKSPTGIGLLSAVASYAANARRGQPINSLGRGLAGGLVGYQQANDQTDANATEKQQRELRDLQIQQARQAMEATTRGRQLAADAYKSATVPAKPGMPAAFNVGGQSFPDMGEAQRAARSAFNVPTAALPGKPAGDMYSEAMGMPASLAPQPMGIANLGDAPIQEQPAQEATPGGFDRRKYLDAVMAAGPDHPLFEEANKMLLKANETKYGNKVEFTADGRGYVMGDDGTPKFVDGITPRDELVADNLGGTINYRTKFSPEPVAVAERTVSPDAALGSQTTLQNGALNRGVTLRGQDLTNARGREANALKAREVGIIGGKQAFDAEGKMADDYKAQSKTFVDVRDGYTRLNTSLKNATTSAAATLAGATSFMKLLDPGSVVRESELGMALQASGVLDRATNYYNTLQRGKVLTPSQAKDFANIGKQIYAAAEANQKSLQEQYGARAANYGLNPKNIITDYTIKEPPKPDNPRGAGTFREPIRISNEADYNSVPKGKYYQAPDGSIRVRK